MNPVHVLLLISATVTGTVLVILPGILAILAIVATI